MRHRLVLVFAVVASLAAAVPGLARAATIVVDSTADGPLISPGADECTLRDAIEDAIFDDSNYGDCLSGDGDDTIVFQLPAGSTITLTAGELALPSRVAGQNIDIEGPGADELTISGGDASRVFQVFESPLGVQDTISGLTIASGKVESGEESEGGGVLNKGDLTLAGVVVEGNEAKATGSSVVTGNGGGIANESNATLTLERSAVAGNTAGAVASGGGLAYADGGGIFNKGALAIIDSTIADNGAIAVGGGGQSASGGGIANVLSSPLAVTSSTIAGNAVVSGFLASGANVLATGTAEFENTIVTAPEGATNCAAPVTSHGFNLEDGETCGFAQSTDQPNTNPRLAAAGLADNGGPTPTMLPRSASMAIDAGEAMSDVDQRGQGFPRLVGTGVDIGAVESDVIFADGFD